MGQKEKGTGTGSGAWSGSLVSIAILALLVLVLCSSLSQARYLPTRSDESRREHIKDILRMLMEGQEGASEAEFQGRSPVRGPSPFGYEDQGRPSGFGLSKRSVPEEGGSSGSTNP
jgi:hypothetical protein